MGKINRFMPTNEYSLYDVHKDGEIFWVFRESETTQSSHLTIFFIRNVPNIDNPNLKEMLYKRGLGYLDSKEYHNYTDKPGIFEEIDFWDPHVKDVPRYLAEAKIVFDTVLMNHLYK